MSVTNTKVTADRLCQQVEEMKKDRDEYLRRNLIHCKAVGIEAIADAAIARLMAQANPPEWLLDALAGISGRAAEVHPEMAKHRNEVPHHLPVFQATLAAPPAKLPTFKAAESPR